MTAGADELVASSNPALVVVTTAASGERSGCLVGFHSQSSIEPFRYAIWLSKANHTYRVAVAATHFAVHFLRAGDARLAEIFGTESGDSVDKFARCRWSVGEGGVPLLDGLPAILFVKEATWDVGGDHVCFVGNPVVALATETFDPLRLSAAEGLEPGHPAGDRPDTGPSAREHVQELQELATGFGHELTPEQIESFEAEHEVAADAEDPGVAS